jgi:hypothetical protein
MTNNYSYYLISHNLIAIYILLSILEKIYSDSASLSMISKDLILIHFIYNYYFLILSYSEIHKSGSSIHSLLVIHSISSLIFTCSYSIKLFSHLIQIFFDYFISPKIYILQDSLSDIMPFISIILIYCLFTLSIFII